MRTPGSIKLTIAGILLAPFLLANAVRAQDSSEAASAQEKSYDIPPGYILIEGDILVRQEAYDQMRIQGVWTTKFWPGGNIPYVFNANVNAAERANMINAMAEWENIANVNFKPRNGENDYVHIRESSGSANISFSSVGRQGGQQFIDIGSNHWTRRFVMAHELGHTLGLWHEQSRTDRDDYITVVVANIDPKYIGNFNKHNEADVYPKQAYGLPGDETYDFDSVMHYGDKNFCKNPCPGKTIIVKPPYAAEWQDRIGQSDHLSFLDALTMSFLYPEGNWRFVDKTSNDPPLGTFLNPAQNVPAGVLFTPQQGTLWIQPGTYSAVGTYNKPMTLRAPLGHVTLGN